LRPRILQALVVADDAVFRLSLRQSLTLPFVALVLGVAVLIGALSYRAGSQAVDTVADNLLLETASRIGQAVDRHVVGSGAVLEAAFPNGMVAPESIDRELDDLRGRFWIATSLHLDPNNYVYYGNRLGQFFGLWRHSLQEGELRIKRQAEVPRGFQRFSGINGTLAAPQFENRVFDPRVRPWYKAGASNPSHTWTAIYIDFRTSELVATRARRVLGAGGEVEGVVATDVSLRQLNDFVRKLHMSPRAVAFIIEPDGNLIASSRSPNVQRAFDGSFGRVNAAASDDALQVAAYAQVRQALSPQPSVSVLVSGERRRTMSFTGPDGAAVQLAYEHLRDDAGLDWTTVVAVPRSDFMRGVTENVLRTAIIGTLAALVAVALGLAILGWLSRDLARLARAARAVGEGRLDAPLSILRNDEIGDLAGSFRQMQERLRTDMLTGLVNRDVIVRSIAERLRHPRRSADAHPFAVLFIDLNNFKRVNDQLGHEAGDRALVEVAARLRSATRAGDLVARYAGDEFVVLLDRVADAGAADHVRLHIEGVLCEPLKSLGDSPGARELRGAAVGLALYPGDGEDAEALIRHADHDMYTRKRRARGQAGH
jgi:diguanylate cyclase (GGDEF)-like protein